MKTPLCLFASLGRVASTACAFLTGALLLACCALLPAQEALAQRLEAPLSAKPAASAEPAATLLHAGDLHASGLRAGDRRAEEALQRDRHAERLWSPPVGYTIPNQPAARGQVWANFGIGRVDGFFDADGDYEDLGSFTIPQGPLQGTEVETNAEIISYVLHVGTSVDVAQLRNYNLSVGADLGLVNQEQTGDAFSAGGQPIAPETDVTSGFRPQQLSLFAEAVGATYSARAGYMLDLGPSLDDLDEDERDNSDRQDAVMVGLSAQFPFEQFRVFGGFDQFFLIENDDLVEEVDDEVSYNRGDITSLHLGAGYRVEETLELGVTGLLRFNTEGELDDSDDFPTPLGQQGEFETGYVFGVVPYVTYLSPDSPLQVSLRGAVQREYYDYGYSVIGESDIAPRLGATLSVTYGL